MAIFGKKTTKDEKKADGKSANVANDKKEEKKASMKDLYEGGASTKTEGGKKEVRTRKYGNAYKVLVRPLVTEKASIQGAEGKYFFEVGKQANKIEIAKAIQEVYGVKPISVNVIRMGGKNVKYGKKTGQRKDWKKAIITLAKGQTIKVYEGV